MSEKDNANQPNPNPTYSDSDIEAYIQKLELADIRSWTKEAQATYIRARLKAREEEAKSGQKKTDSYSHWDLF